MADIDELIFDTLIDGSRLHASDQNNWRYKVLMGIADAGDHGATDNELADLLKAPGGQNNLRPRRGELVEYGYVVDSGLRRRTSSGSQATVWRLNSTYAAALTPVFTAADCQLAELVADGAAHESADRDAAARLRARLALLGRRVRRAVAADGATVEASIQRAGRPELALWRGDGDRERFRLAAHLDGDGLHLTLLLPPAPEGVADADPQFQRFRHELALLPDQALGALDALVSSGWTLSIDSPQGKAVVESPRMWLQSLANDPMATGRAARDIDPAALERAGASIADELAGLASSALPLEAAAESAMRDPVQALVNGLLWDPERARRMIALARRSRQLLFAGPPGTGKTLAARLLATALADAERVKLVQFHPSYAYEDFVEGIRPVIDRSDQAAAESNDEAGDASSGLRYTVRDGIFKVLSSQAQETAQAPHFLIVDEINRANLPRVLGELLFALEYRGVENAVELAYSGDEFYVPENLWLIGTMNTADRSVAVLDAAMRRRFKEVRFDVDYVALRRWHERHTSSDLGAEAAARLERLNREVVELLDDDRAIGHSFLMRTDLPDIGFEAVWSEDLEPVLRDHLLGRTDDLPALRGAFLGEL